MLLILVMSMTMSMMILSMIMMIRCYSLLTKDFGELEMERATTYMCKNGAESS